MASDIRDTNLYELLGYLKNAKRQLIMSFVEMKLISVKGKELCLLKEVLRHINKKKSKPLYKKDLIKKTSIPEKKINHITNALSKKIRRILPALDLLKDYKEENEHLLTMFFLEKGLHKNAQSMIRNTSKTLKRQSSLSLYDFHFYEMKYHETCLILSGELDRIDAPNLDGVNNSLDRFYIENKLRLLCMEILRSLSFSKKEGSVCNASFKKTLLDLILEKAFFNSIYIELFFHVYIMLSTNSEDSYNKVYTLLGSYRGSISPETESEVIKYMMNQCTLFWGSGLNSRKYAIDFIDFSTDLEKLDLILNINEKYSLVLFHNIIFKGIEVKSQEWCEHFIKTRAMKLDSSNQLYNEIVHLAYVKVSFGHYKEAAILIQELNSPERLSTITPKDHLFISLFYYRVFIHIYFKVETELALKKNDALRKYFDRNKKNIPLLQRDRLDTFIKFTRRIITTPKYSKNWTLLKDKISQKKSKIAYMGTINFMLKNKN